MNLFYRKFSSNLLKVLFLLIIFQMPLLAKVKLASLFKENMVLQREDSVPIWGWANPGEKITIHVGWSDKVYNLKANNNGEWKALIKTPKAGGPYTITVNDLTIKGILIGEVWLCSGQSNMVMPLEGWGKIKNYEEEIANANYPEIRMFYVAREIASEPNETCYGKWYPIQPETVAELSAVAYFFGRKLFEELNIPIGLILSAWGGTPAEAWTSEEALESEPELSIYLQNYQRIIEFSGPGILPRNSSSPSSLFNGMIAPLIPFSIRGTIWYQGESNVSTGNLYEKLFSTMITDWRSKWGIGDFPFYFAQIAPYRYETEVVGALIRDEQRKTLSLPNTGMAVTLDIGNVNDIHPKNKQEVGRRLALWALANDYGYKNLVYSGPLYKKMEILGNKIQIEFDHIGSGLVVHGAKPNCFQIASEDRKFYPADAEIVNNKVLVSNPDIKNPVAVRFAYKNTDEPNLFNKEGLPASTFRTDNWPIITAVPRFETFINKDNNILFLKLSSDRNDQIYYTLDGSEATIKSNLYENPIQIKNQLTVNAIIYQGITPALNSAKFTVVPHLAVGKTIQVRYAPNPMYLANGNQSLIDGILGSYQFADKAWQGYNKNDLVATIDLKAIEPIHTIESSYLQNIIYWIFYPRYVEYQYSNDGKNFQTLKKINSESPDNEKIDIQKFTLKNINKSARFIRVIAKSIGVCPEWHPGNGENAWLFVDEIIVK